MLPCLTLYAPTAPGLFGACWVHRAGLDAPRRRCGRPVFWYEHAQASVAAPCWARETASVKAAIRLLTRDEVFNRGCLHFRASWCVAPSRQPGRGDTDAQATMLIQGAHGTCKAMFCNSALQRRNSSAQLLQSATTDVVLQTERRGPCSRLRDAASYSAVLCFMLRMTLSVVRRMSHLERSCHVGRSVSDSAPWRRALRGADS